MFQGIAREEPSLENDALLCKIRAEKNASGFVYAIGTNLILSNKVRFFLILSRVSMIDNVDTGRRIARRVVAYILPAHEESVCKTSAMSLFAGSRRGKIDVIIASPRRALEASFATVASEMEREQNDAAKREVSVTTQAQCSHPLGLKFGSNPDTPAVADVVLSGIDDHMSTLARPKDSLRSRGGQEEAQYENINAKSIPEDTDTKARRLIRRGNRRKLVWEVRRLCTQLQHEKYEDLRPSSVHVVPTEGRSSGTASAAML